MQRKPIEFTLDAFAQSDYWCWELFTKYQKASDDLDIIKEHSKDYLALLMTEIERENPNMKLSDTKLERLARSSEKWKAFREGYSDAVKVYGLCKVKYYSAKRYYETIQSGLAYKREELKRLS